MLSTRLLATRTQRSSRQPAMLFIAPGSGALLLKWRKRVKRYTPKAGDGAVRFAEVYEEVNDDEVNDDDTNSVSNQSTRRMRTFFLPMWGLPGTDEPSSSSEDSSGVAMVSSAIAAAAQPGVLLSMM